MSLLIFLVFLAACAGAATSGALFGPDRWYDGLEKPWWTPPNWAFPLAWSVAYLLVAVAAWRIAVAEPSMVQALALALWSLQIVLNALWTPTFFGLHRIVGGMVVLSSLWTVTLVATAVFFTVDGLAGVLFVLYLAWLSYAASLNYGIWQRNGAGPGSGDEASGGEASSSAQRP